MKTIEELLKKYYKGESNKEEEQILIKMLRNSNIGDFRTDKILFDYFDSRKKHEELTDNFDEKILNQIKASRISKSDYRQKIQKIINIAAILAVITSVVVFYYGNDENTRIQVTKQDYEAYLQTYLALSKASEYMNLVNVDLAKLEVVEEAFVKLEKINEIEYYQNYINNLLGE